MIDAILMVICLSIGYFIGHINLPRKIGSVIYYSRSGGLELKMDVNPLSLYDGKSYTVDFLYSEFIDELTGKTYQYCMNDTRTINEIMNDGFKEINKRMRL